MKRLMYFASAAVLLIAPTVYSQQPPAAGQKIGLATSLQRGYAGIKANFTAAAEKMPEADYSFKVGSMPEARTYGQLIAGYKCPRTVTLRTEPLPLSGAGKVLKTVLRKELQL